MAERRLFLESVNQMAILAIIKSKLKSKLCFSRSTSPNVITVKLSNHKITVPFSLEPELQSVPVLSVSVIYPGDPSRMVMTNIATFACVKSS
ncbi:hypothetical protein TNCV_2834561 [Trichonephila clavipes]|nr:hypothetical protein TNCV_2834561 [Trichonephila clavipes]